MNVIIWTLEEREQVRVEAQRRRAAKPDIGRKELFAEAQVVLPADRHREFPGARDFELIGLPVDAKGEKPKRKYTRRPAAPASDPGQDCYGRLMSAIDGLADVIAEETFFRVVEKFEQARQRRVAHIHERLAVIQRTATAEALAESDAGNGE